MESMLVTSSVFPETYPLLNNIPSSPLPPSIKLHNTKRTGSLRFAQNPHFISLRLPALARHVSGGDGDDQGPLTNGSAFFSDETLSLPQVIMFFSFFLLVIKVNALFLELIDWKYTNLWKFLQGLRKSQEKEGKIVEVECCVREFDCLVCFLFRIGEREFFYCWDWKEISFKKGLNFL